MAAAVLGACGGGGGSSDAGTTSSTTHKARTDVSVPDQASTTTAPASPGTSYVATAVPAKVQVFSKVGDAKPKVTLPNPTENGGPLVFLAEHQLGGWLQVLLPIRPNGSTGWVRLADVKVATNPYRVDIALGAHRLVVHKGTAVVADDSIGVGTSSTPTPGGKYYIKELLKPSNPGGAYGPYAYGLSGFSNVLDDFNGGDGVIGIHGTDDPSTVGHDVSHGCIRLTNANITKLVQVLPLGTPVHISA